MKKLLITCICLLLHCFLQAQGLAQAEYYMDTDPGVGNGIPVPMTIANADSVQFNVLASTASLSEGFHTIGIRMKENSGLWGLSETRSFYLSSSALVNTSIVSAEYFIDTDPGMGNGTPVSVGSVGNTVNFAIVLNTSSLQPGFHTIAIRTKDITGNWSLFETRGFYISTVATAMSAINAAEYFVDTDPGVGKATAVNVGTSGDSVSFLINLNISSLTEGFHSIAIRTKESNGNWSLFETRSFYISSHATSPANITAAEYFIDADPGIGSATALNTGTQNNAVNFIASIPTASLADGFHTLAIRTKNADGQWGLFETRNFYISKSVTAPLDTITAAEYFIDTDPGAGNGNILPVTNPNSIVNQTFICTTPLGLTSGQHFIFIRVKDNNNIWSLIEIDTFQVSGNPTPITGFRLMASKKEQHALLNWETLTEQNTKDFEIDRSRNGIEFERIGTTKAVGNSNAKQSYTFLDATPYNELNFYRIKQTDINGDYAYSNIVQLLFATENTSIKLYPNPAKDVVNIAMPASGNYWVHCYNDQGQLVAYNNFVNTRHMQLDVNNWIAGKYHIRISNGTTLFNGSIIKLD